MAASSKRSHRGVERLRSDIARKVRELRTGRGWTQAELAERLDASQARLSEIERGDGSFSAEQLLTLFKLFNVGPDHFAPAPVDRNAESRTHLRGSGRSTFARARCCRAIG
jgi:transcriptional regulator with XRE-family HTH domain